MGSPCAASIESSRFRSGTEAPRSQKLADSQKLAETLSLVFCGALCLMPRCTNASARRSCMTQRSLEARRSLAHAWSESGIRGSSQDPIAFSRRMFRCSGGFGLRRAGSQRRWQGARRSRPPAPVSRTEHFRSAVVLGQLGRITLGTIEASKRLS